MVFRHCNGQWCEMALVKFSISDLNSFVKVPPSELDDALALLGIPLESLEGDQAAVEITPNRPDWLSVEGIARSLADFKTGKPKQYFAQPAKVEWVCDPSVKSVRPALGSAIVRGVKTSDAFIASMMQLQEKLHDTLGRSRKKLAIGLHNLEAVSPPFTYLAVGREEVRFVPLSRATPMTPAQILSEHEKGVEYAHLVGEKCPMIVDGNGEVLSFPPIINGERTRVTESTVDFLIDCTGNSEQAVNAAVQIIAAALCDRGGKAEEVKINGKRYPLFQPFSVPLSLDWANRLLGIKMQKSDAARHLARMGHRVAGGKVLVMPWRIDVMHSVDLVEDIAISYGYNEFEPSVPQFYSVGNLDMSDASMHSALLGLGYFEVQSWMLTNEKSVLKARANPPQISLENPLTEEFSVLRPLLYPNHLQILSQSRTEPMPQYIYEIGTVFGKASEEPRHIAASACHPKAGFSEIKSHLDSFCKAISAQFDIVPAILPGFIPGRACKILRNGAEIGFAGEIHPEVLSDFGIEQPVSVFELDAKGLSK